MATPGTLSLNQSLAVKEPQVVPFAGGEVFNPAEWIRITNRDPESWGHLRPGAVSRGGGKADPIWMEGKSRLAKQAIYGRYNGKDYLFPFEQPVNVHIDVARHIFGLGLDDKSDALSRLGWVRSSEQMGEAIERLFLVQFDDLPELMEQARFKSPDIAHASGLVKGDGTEGAPKGAPKDPALGR